MPCLIDTNVLIHALSGNAQASVLSRIDNAIANQARYSVVTRMELLGWNGHTADSRRETEVLLAQLMEIPLTPTIVALVIDIRSTITIKLPDAIIAASALVENLPLMTCNTGDFKRIAGLVVIDPFVA
ncbi:MAG: type II toxin-antitoxin system VapC family toxin [Nitrosomonadales bacterium]|nr:type II toxin-antitoxin system VapC family toxin [Nitrosomonadales bacterium]